MGLLTRLPVWRLVPEAPARFVAAIWAYPLVGALVGVIGAGIYAGCTLLGVSPAVSAIWTVAAMLLVTGGLHEDGLADTLDGLGGGGTAERKLAIMRDSRIGAFGAMGLVLVLILQVAALTAIGTASGVAVALVVSGAVSRGGIIVALLTTGPARKDGMASGLSEPPLREACAGLGFAALAAIVLAPGGFAAIAVLTVAAAVGMARLARAQIGGHTGDILGATAILAECAALSVLAR
jgi:adenosylcobinamide-GDP ribazoletransferase